MHTPLLLPAMLGGVQRLTTMAEVCEFLSRHKQPFQTLNGTAFVSLHVMWSYSVPLVCYRAP